MIDVAQVEQEQWEEVLSLMFGALPPNQRDTRVADVLRAEREGELSLDGLLKVQERTGEIVAAGFYSIQDDRTAYLWPPYLGKSPVQDEVADALMQSIGSRIDAGGALMGQCLIEQDEQCQRAALSRNGFVHLADLGFLQRPLDKPLPALPDIRFETTTFDSATNRERFARLLEATYVETRDCPQFNDARSGEDALRSHRTSGRFDPELWKVYRVAGRDVGVLLLSDHPDQDAWEVVYVGIVPQARGHQYGRALVLSGLHEARAALRSSVFLAVDRQNSYATRIYDDLQFDEVGVRAVHVRWPVRTEETGSSTACAHD